jgi:hypothetical protein
MARLSLLIMIVLLWSMPRGAEAQTAQPATAPEQALLKTEELDQLLAPIALYPDPLLSQVLIASTYPLEVVQAERWATQNKSLKGDQLKTEADKQAWDDSVKSLVATPSVLTMMSTKLDWTQKLGDAVLAQQTDIMDAIQRLRSRAHANNKLTSTKEQKVTVKQEQNKQVIAIEPAVADTIHVPYYNPAVVYGGWPYPAYPPYYWPAAWLHRRRDHCDRHCLRRRICPRALGLGRKFMGRGFQLGQQQHQREPVRQQHQRQELAARFRAPARREIQQCRRAAEIRQDRRPGRQGGATGLPRQGRPESARPRPRPSRRRRSRPPWRG